MGHLSAVVCTRNRASAAAKVVASLLAGDTSPELELFLIDQSDGQDTAEAVAALAVDSRFRYVRSRGRGKGAALNEGLALASGEIVVFTDDDCEAPPNWVSDMTRVLAAQATAALLFCNVRPAPYDTTQGYIPAYQRTSDRLVRSVIQTCAGHGLGAGMAVRRSVVLELGGFDESVGPGARFPSGDDWDIEHRLLLNGWHVYETAELSIVHDGFRTFEEGRAHTRRDWVAIGAVCAKPLRAGHLRAAVIPLWAFGVDALWPPLSLALRGKRPRGMIRIVGFLEGFAGGLRTAVDRRTLLFRR